MSGVAFTETDMGSKGRVKTAFKRLPREITKEARWRLQVWWEKVKETAKALCPIDTGSLMMTIRIEPMGVSIGFYYEKAMSPEHELIDAQIVAGGIMVNPKSGRIVDYAQAVHDGHFTRGGKYIPEQPFLRDAVNLHINELHQILGVSVRTAVNTVYVGE